jgi:NifU-like protein
MYNDAVRDVYSEVVDRHVIRTQDVYQTETEIGTVGYSDKLLSVVANFTNSGIPEGSNACGMCGKAKRGKVVVQLFARIDGERRVIEEAGFRSHGCLAMTACASLICSMITGATFEQALAITPRQLTDALDGVPADKLETPYYATEAVHALIGDYILNGGGSPADLRAGGLCNQSSANCLLCEQCSLRNRQYDLIAEQMKAVASA